MSTAPSYIPHYTVADYEQWSGDWELWQGTAVSMTPSPFGPHQHISARLLVEFSNQLEALQSHLVVLPEIDWRISEDTVVRPDVVICERIPTRHLESAPVLIAEVLSASTSEKDRTAKFELYRSEGVNYYLLVDPTAKTLEAFELVEDCYEQVAAESRLSIASGCELKLIPSRIFRHPDPDFGVGG